MSEREYSSPTFENLEPRLLMAASPFPSAAPVTLSATNPTVISASIISAGEQDVYAFRAIRTGVLNIDMSVNGAALRSNLAVYDGQGNILVNSLDDASLSHDGHLSLVVAANQQLYVKAIGANSTTGTYRLSLNNAADDVGNTRTTAKALTCVPTGLQITGKIDYLGDLDVYAIKADRTGTLTAIANRQTGSSLDTELVFCDSNGVEQALNQNASDATSIVTGQVVAGQTYYVKILGNAWSQGTYQMTVAISTSAPTPPAPPDGAQSTVTATVVDVSHGQGMWQLQVLGTNSADTIAISQNGGSTIVTANGKTFTFSQTFVNVMVNSYGGDDTITINNSVAVIALVMAGDGNDTIYDNGKAVDKIFGEAGNDLLVSVGNGVDQLSGGAGTDSFWCDSTDVLADVTADERSAGDVHQITSLYQPFTNDPSSSNYVSFKSGQSLTDPNSGGFGYMNFSGNALFSSAGPSSSDISQGAVGDCYFMSALSSLADQNSNSIRQMITSLGDGTYMVRMYRNGVANYIRVDGDLPVTSGGSLVYADLGKSNTLWAALTEKAYAFFRTGQNSYASLSGGWMGDVYTQVTNAAYTNVGTSGSGASLASFLTQQLASGKAVTAGSYSGLAVNAPIVGNHAYEVKKVEITSAGTFITVYNPWGYDGRSYDSNGGDGMLRLSVADFQKYFMAVCVSMA